MLIKNIHLIRYGIHLVIINKRLFLLKKYNLETTLNIQLIISLHLILIITHLWC